MSDILERLRAPFALTEKDVQDAVDEIERLREALKPFAEMQLWTDAYPDGLLSATSEKRFVDPLWIVAAREAIREGGKDDI